MWLKLEHVDDVALLIPGRLLIGGPDMDQLESEVERLIAGGQRKIALDMAKVQILASLSIKRLVQLQERTKEAGVAFCLCNADRILQIPAHFWVNRLFQVYATREECLREMAQSRSSTQESTNPQ
jgi:anti-anti-sigma regulatory factor